MAPNVLIDGRRFYADRPYLNAMAGTAPTLPPASTTTADEEREGEPVQLFSRARLVASLAASEEGLEACILCTYALDVPDVEEEFPALFAKGSGVPTLLLHGDRRVRRTYAAAGSSYRVWKEVQQQNPNVEMPRGYRPQPFWAYEAMDPRIQVRGAFLIDAVVVESIESIGPME